MNTEIPIGGILAWTKTYTNVPQTLPYGWVEANGQTLNDPLSLFNGSVIPDLNSASNRFLRGNLTSGGVGGATGHSHSITFTSGSFSLPAGSSSAITSITNPTSTGNNLPLYYDIVWIFRVK